MIDNRQLFFDNLTQAGLSPQQALGALWSLGGESYPNLRTDAESPDKHSYGVAQWTQDRLDGLQRYAAAIGKPVSDPQTQADYLIQGELLGRLPGYAAFQANAWNALQAAKTPADAARVWTQLVERPKVDNSEQRIQQGKAVGSIDAQGRFIPGTAPAVTAVYGPPAPTAPVPAAAPARAALTPGPAANTGIPLASAVPAQSPYDILRSIAPTFTNLGIAQTPRYSEPIEQPAFRTPAAMTDFSGPPANPVPASLAGGTLGSPLASQLGRLGAQVGDPLLTGSAAAVAPSITQGAPSMTALLPNQGQIGWTGGMASAIGGRGNIMNPYFTPQRLS